MKLSFLSSFAALLLCQRTQAFTTLSPTSVGPSRPLAMAVSEGETDIYWRAIKCAEGDSSDLEELEKLATGLETAVSQYEEEGAENMEREVRDRLDVAHMLRLRIELQLRLDYLNGENLFASDVKKSHDRDERRRFRQLLEENRDKVVDGSDLGLW